MDDHALELKHQGNRALARRDYGSAERSFRALVDLSPDSFEGYVGLSKVLERTHDHQAIVDLLEPALGKVRAPVLLKALGDAYRVLANRGDRGATDRAILHYEGFLRERKDPVTLFYLAELYRQRGDCGRALMLLRESWSLDPGSRTVYAAALDCAKKVGRESDLTEIESWRSQIRA